MSRDSSTDKNKHVNRSIKGKTVNHHRKLNSNDELHKRKKNYTSISKSRLGSDYKSGSKRKIYSPSPGLSNKRVAIPVQSSRAILKIKRAEKQALNESVASVRTIKFQNFNKAISGDSSHDHEKSQKFSSHSDIEAMEI